MSFSDETRQELARVIPTARCCKTAELSAIYELDGFLLGDKNQFLDFNHASPVVARKILHLLRGLYPDLPTQILVVKPRAKRSQTCTVRVLGHRWAARVYS